MDDSLPKQSDFFTAVSSGGLDTIQNIIAKMQSIADTIQMINCIGTYDGESFTALNVAIRCNQPEALKEMLKGVIGKQREEIFLSSRDSMENGRSFHLAAKYSTDASLLMTMMETLSSTQIMGLMCATTKEQWTPLHVAAENNKSCDVVRALIGWADKDQRLTLLSKMTVNQSTPIHIADRDMDKDALKVMLEMLDTEQRMSLLSMKEDKGWTPIHIAAQHSADAMKVMLELLDTEQRMSLLSMKKDKGRTPMHVAAQFSADAMTVMLDTLDTEQRMTLLSVKKGDGPTPVHVAAQCSADVMKVILEMLDTEQRMSLLSMKEVKGRTPIHIAAKHNADAMKVMLETLDTEHRMTLLSMKIDHGWTQVHGAVQHSTDAMKMMLEMLDIARRMPLLSLKEDKGWTPIHIAAQLNADAMKVMLETLDTEHRMTLLSMKIDHGWTQVHDAAQHSADAMKMMMEMLDIEQRMTLLGLKEDKGWTPIHIAAQHSADAMKVMLELLDTEQRMSLLSMKKDDGRTPMHVAAQFSADAMTVMLDTLDTEQRMTLLSMKKGDGPTPVHVAAQCSADVMKVILEMLDTEQRMSLLSMEEVVLLSMEEVKGRTPINIAAKHNADAMKVMFETLDTEHRMTLLSMKIDHGWTPVHDAAQHSADAMTVMLEMLDPEQRMSLLSMKTDDDRTPVHLEDQFSMFIHDTMLVQEQLRYLSEIGRNWTPMHVAARSNADALKLMLDTLEAEQRLALLSMKSKTELTPVHEAAQSSTDAEVMRLMLEKMDRKQIITLMSMRDVLGDTPIHRAAHFNRNKSIICLMIEKMDAHEKLAQLGARDSNRNNALEICKSRKLVNEIITAFKNEDIVTKIKFLNLQYGKERKVHHVLIADSEISVALDFLSASSVRYNLKKKLCLMISSKTGNAPRDSRMVFQMRNAYPDLQIDAQLMLSLFDYMASSDSIALFQLLHFLLTNSESSNQPFRKEDHMLLWEDGNNNNFLHLAASVDHTQFICKIISTQHGDEINHALVTKNKKGQAPYYLAAAQETRRLLAWSETQDGCYPLITSPRVVVFYSDENRPGSEKEKDSFLNILPALSIEATVIKNPSKKDIYDGIRDHQTGEVSALIVAIMAHGNKGTVTAQDGPLPIDNILMQMNPRNLSGIPKVLILQACQGAATSRGATDNANLSCAALERMTDHSATSLDSSPRTHQPEKSRTDKAHYDLSGPDMAVVAATINKQTATRNLLMPLLAEQLQNAKQDDDLSDIFRKTVDILRHQEPCQVPEFRTTMRNKLCLHKVFRQETPYKSSVEPPTVLRSLLNKVWDWKYM